METIQAAARKMMKKKGGLKGRPGPHSKIKRGKKAAGYTAGKMKKKAGALKMKKDDKYSPSDRGGKIGIGKIKKKTMGKAKKPMGMK